jgi:hypothetical protein
VAPELTKTQFVWTILQDERGVVARRKSAWMLTPEPDIDDVIPTTECVQPYVPDPKEGGE